MNVFDLFNSGRLDVWTKKENAVSIDLSVPIVNICFNSFTSFIAISNYLFVKNLHYNCRILDAGCGDGFGTFLLSYNDCDYKKNNFNSIKRNNVLGIDSNSNLIGIAKDTYKNNDFKEVNFYQDDLLDLGSFGVIVNYIGYQCFEELNNKERLFNLFKKFNTMLTFGGKFYTYEVLSVKYNYNIYEILNMVFSDVQSVINYRAGFFLPMFNDYLDNDFKYKIYICTKGDLKT